MKRKHRMGALPETLEGRALKLSNQAFTLASEAWERGDAEQYHYSRGIIEGIRMLVDYPGGASPELIDEIQHLESDLRKIGGLPY
jgi:hypothetical protein